MDGETQKGKALDAELVGRANLRSSPRRHRTYTQKRNLAGPTFVPETMCRLGAYACFFLISLVSCAVAQQDKHDERVREQVAQHEYDLSGDGKVFLSDEARRASFFLLGELHGENEIPALLRELWPGMWRDGYRYVAAELSPWAANQLEFTPSDRQVKLAGLWSKQEALFVHSLSAGPAVLWGCDMEEMQPQLLIRDLAAVNPANAGLSRMLDITRSGYRREMASQLLQLGRGLTTTRDVSVNDTSLLGNVEATLEIDSFRLNADTKLQAQLRRESLMKELFLLHYQKSMSSNPEAKVMLRFGRNHLHRGYDGRGISTLGNFVAEFALAQHKTAFNVAAFGAGGKASLAGETWDADERSEDAALALLASLARYPATVFDLRPLRQTLHRIPDENRSPVEQRLVFWADSYDAIICYKNVTPLNP